MSERVLCNPNLWFKQNPINDIVARLTKQIVANNQENKQEPQNK